MLNVITFFTDSYSNSSLAANQEAKTPDSFIPLESIKDQSEENSRLKSIRQCIYEIFNCTVGYPLKESTKEEHNKWKIKGYEDRLAQAQVIIHPLLFTSSFSANALSDEFKQTIQPLIQLTQKNISQIHYGETKYSLNRLDRLRSDYQNFLSNLRSAVSSTIAQKDKEGSQLIDALCYRLYTEIDLNERCYKILKTFCKIGAKTIQNNDSVDPIEALSIQNHQFELVKNLFPIHAAIKAVQTGLKSPIVKQAGSSLLGHVNGLPGFPFDPNSQSNPIHVLFEKHLHCLVLNEKRMMKSVAMGTPTIEHGRGVAHINPEFLAYLRHCKEMNIPHFYINNQNLIPKSVVKGDESVRCQALHALAKNEEFENIFYVATFSQDSDFYEHHTHVFKNVQAAKDYLLNDYKQTIFYTSSNFKDVIQKSIHQWIYTKLNTLHEEHFNQCMEFDAIYTQDVFLQKFFCDLYEYLDDRGVSLEYSLYNPLSQLFKKELLAQLFDKPSKMTGNKFPSSLVEKFQLRNWTKNMIEEVHTLVFNDQSFLTMEQKRIFIRLVYRNLTQKLLLVSNAQVYNVSCKDRIDRGAATEAEDFAYFAILNNCEQDMNMIKFFNMLVFSRAIIVRKRSMISHRLERLIETVNYLIENKEKIQMLEKQLFPDLSVQIVYPTFEKKKRYSDISMEFLPTSMEI